MSGVSGGVIMATHEAREACRGEKDIIERLKKAMRVTHDHWMETNESEQFRSAVVAAMLESDADDSDRIKRSFAHQVKVAALMQALICCVPVDLEKMAAEPRDPDLIPLQDLWRETEGRRPAASSSKGA
jgi:hypothetical protein